MVCSPVNLDTGVESLVLKVGEGKTLSLVVRSFKVGAGLSNGLKAVP